VDFDLSADQIALQEAATTLLDARCTPARVRAAADAADGVDRELWAAMADQGWMAVERAESLGGLGLGAVEVAVLCEQLGRHLAPVPFGPTLVAHAALAAALAQGEVDESAPLGEGSGSAGAARWAERLSAGDAVGALAWSARPGALRARRDGAARWRLSGRADPVVHGPDADVVVVLAYVDDEPAVFARALSARPRREPSMDRTRSVGWLVLDDEPAVWLGGAAAADTVIDRAVVAVSAEMLGAATAVLDMSVQYAKDRVQFGRPIGSFQAVKHRCADMLVDVEGMRSAVYYSAWAVGAADPDRSAAASAAKVWCSDAARRVMASGLQVHGGIGFTWEHDLHLFLKRSQLDQVTMGDATFHRERIARILRPKAEAGQPVL
jgi:alkylation response protein AidB-like acyl-CoA dehydrogenase